MANNTSVTVDISFIWKSIRNLFWHKVLAFNAYNQYIVLLEYKINIKKSREKF
jgi:hypothetical protein